MIAGATARANNGSISPHPGSLVTPQAALFLFLEESMNQDQIPIECIHCIEQYQARCPHLRISYTGQVHYSNGEVWDDIREICDDCGIDLADLPMNNESTPEDGEEIPF
jgi:hypothetical protein